MDSILKVEHLSKSYKDIKAVQDISFEVKRGSLFAFLGPNGAGKSTTINMITTMLSRDTGNILLNEQDDAKYFRKKIGVVFQNNVLDDLLTVKENLILRGYLYIKSKEDVLERYHELRDFLGFEDYEEQKFKTLSGGQKRRVEIARALFSNPELLLLDEPTTGLDPETRQVVWKVIDRLRKEKGLTIFLTTHYMEEASNADHVIIINHGKIVTQGTPATLKDAYSYDRIKIQAKHKIEFKAFLDKQKIPFEKVSDQFIIRVNETNEAFDLLAIFKPYTKSFEVIKGTMDDVFINVIGGENNA
jgi:multidrug/hemolysin transport system ATP-binding protein